MILICGLLHFYLSSTIFMLVTTENWSEIERRSDLNDGEGGSFIGDSRSWLGFLWMKLNSPPPSLP